VAREKREMLIRQKRNEFEKKILERQAKMEAQLAKKMLERYLFSFQSAVFY
jgi:hypothetical protein